MKKTIWLALLVFSCTLGFGQQYKVIWSFGSVPNDGWQPEGALISDHNGNLYGTTRLGGIENAGIVFKLHPQSDGTWTETILYNFCSVIVEGVCTDGAYPSAGLVFDSQGNLYGTTAIGGNFCTQGSGCGTVFELSPPTGSMKNWTETVLYEFCSDEGNGDCQDGNAPLSQLVFDAMGNMYGTTEQGGMGHWPLDNGAGTVFELSPSASGWIHNTLYSFCTQGSGSACPDGASSVTGLTFDALGNLYGTTERGGGKGHAYGTIYELSPSADGWTFAVIYSFLTAVQPGASVTFDAKGNLYSTSKQGGKFSAGNIFKASPDHTLLRQVSFNGTDGNQPYSGVIIQNNSLYGTTSGGDPTYGNIYSVDSTGMVTVLYNFCAQTNCADGALPEANLLGTKSGIYGSTIEGGASNQGVAFQLVP